MIILLLNDRFIIMINKYMMININEFFLLINFKLSNFILFIIIYLIYYAAIH